MAKRTLFVTVVDEIDSTPNNKEPKYVVVVENKANISEITDKIAESCDINISQLCVRVEESRQGIEYMAGNYILNKNDSLNDMTLPETIHMFAVKSKETKKRPSAVPVSVVKKMKKETQETIPKGSKKAAASAKDNGAPEAGKKTSQPNTPPKTSPKKSSLKKESASSDSSSSEESSSEEEQKTKSKTKSKPEMKKAATTTTTTKVPVPKNQAQAKKKDSKPKESSSDSSDDDSSSSD